MSNKTFPGAVVAAMLLIGLMLYPFLPEQIPIHWNIHGQIDGMANKAVAVFLLPVITMLLLVIMRFTLMSPQFLARYSEAQDTHWFMVNSIMLFMGFIYALTLIVALVPELSIARAIGIGIGGLFAVMGNVMGRLRPNPYFGFRFPWTMSDEEVWRRTHRVGGRWMVISGVVIMLAALILPPELIFVVMMVLLLGSTAWTVYYSRQLWLERNHMAS